MRSFWKLVLRFKCSRSKSTQMVSSLLYFNLWRYLLRACTKATAKTKRVTFWHAAGSELQVAQNGSDLYIFTSWLRTLAYEKFSRGLFLDCCLPIFFFFILSFAVSLVTSFFLSRKWLLHRPIPVKLDIRKLFCQVTHITTIEHRRIDLTKPFMKAMEICR